MTLKELETLMDDTRRLSHANDKVLQAQALASIEIARQLIILNQSLNGGGSKPAPRKGKKKR
jgi:hypothetical protein